nr:NTP transferase domain-containing protein [Candidatus Njordarchaeota archaeon]
MGITALIMAGGKADRMILREEKPLLKVGRKSMIEHILKALRNARKVDEIAIAVSKHTPKTAKLMEKFPVKVLETPGKGYVADMRYAVRKLKSNTVLIISADLPLVTGEIIDKIVERHRRCNKPALTVVVPMETRRGLGLEGEYVLEAGTRQIVPAGINVIDGRWIDEGELDEEMFVIDKEELAVNVNTLQELEIAERLFARKFCGGINRPT